MYQLHLKNYNLKFKQSLNSIFFMVIGKLHVSNGSWTHDFTLHLELIKSRGTTRARAYRLYELYKIARGNTTKSHQPNIQNISTEIV